MSPDPKRFAACRLSALVLAAALAAQPAWPEGAIAPPEQLVYSGSTPIYHGKIGLKEPSGLTIASDGDGPVLWTVSDDTPRLFTLTDGGADAEESGKIEALEDAEAIEYHPSRGLFHALSEERASIIVVDPAATEDALEYPILSMTGAEILLDALGNDPERLSPEGLAVDGGSGTIFVANERDPRLLIEIAPDLDRIIAVHAMSAELGFRSPGVSDHDLDLSGLAHDPGREGLWIVSDTGECVFFWRAADQTLRRFDLLWLDDGAVRRVPNAEGVALGADGETLFIVTDDGHRSRLHEYRIE